MADSDAAPAADEASTPPPSDPRTPTPAAELLAGGRDRESSSADMARYSSSSSYSPTSASGLLPMPGMTSSTGGKYVARLGGLLRRRDVKIVVAFWLIGLINNILYVIILSAAQDLVGNIPKGVVLLADVTPSLATKLVAPYFIHRVPHWVRVLVFTGLSVGGMLMVALTPPSQSVAVRLVGVAVASLSSGGGELSFLGLSHYYGHLSLAGWGSGTGAAGLAGAGLYVVLTQGWGLSVRDSLLFSACLPSVMLFAFFVVLPHDSLRQQDGWEGYSSVESEQEEEQEEEELEEGEEAEAEADEAGGAEDDNYTESEIAAPGGPGERQGPEREESGFRSLVTPGPPLMRANAEGRMGQAGGRAVSLRVKLMRARQLFLPYMAPLLLVYVAEYSINQGVSPTLLYPVESSPFQQLREFYPFYGFLYQLGVFASRSSTAFFRIRQLYIPAMLQVGNLVLLTLEALLAFIPSVYLVFVIILWEGLLGGAVYVNCFAEILDRVPPQEREFSLGVTAVSDSAGICIAGLASIVLERSLCNYQVAHGRDLCRKVEV